MIEWLSSRKDINNEIKSDKLFLESRSTKYERQKFKLLLKKECLVCWLGATILPCYNGTFSNWEHGSFMGHQIQHHCRFVLFILYGFHFSMNPPAKQEKFGYHNYKHKFIFERFKVWQIFELKIHVYDLNIVGTLYWLLGIKLSDEVFLCTKYRQNTL